MDIGDLKTMRELSMIMSNVMGMDTLQTSHQHLLQLYRDLTVTLANGVATVNESGAESQQIAVVTPSNYITFVREYFTKYSTSSGSTKPISESSPGDVESAAKLISEQCWSPVYCQSIFIASVTGVGCYGGESSKLPSALGVNGSVSYDIAEMPVQ
jgi:hypothetical protein